MDYEKKYKEALNWMKDVYPTLEGAAKEDAEHYFPELKESEDERIRKALIEAIRHNYVLTGSINHIPTKDILAWLEKKDEKGTIGNEKEIPNSEQKPTQEINPFEAEHGKYYFCIKDYFCGGRKQASKGDVVQALRGLPIMGLKDASEYFLPVNFIKCNSGWNEEDEKFVHGLIRGLAAKRDIHGQTTFSSDCIDLTETINWLKSLEYRYTWKPSEEQMKALKEACDEHWEPDGFDPLYTLYQDLKKLRHE